MTEEIDAQRRQLVSTATQTLALARFGVAGVTAVDPRSASAVVPAKPVVPAFGPLRQIEAGDLTVGYVDIGSSNAPVVFLLHGWPYDIHSFADVATELAARGYRCIVPYARGFGTTRFLTNQTVRNAQQAVLAVDVIALMNALRIDKAIVAGFDWGARTANIVAALWPERCKAMVSVSGYLIANREASRKPLAPKAELSWWYQFYFATDRGRAGYEANRHDFAKLIWQIGSPRWNFDAATFDRSASALDNPDQVDIVIHNYRWRIGAAEGEARYDRLENDLAASPVIAIPAITLEGDANGAPHPDSTIYASKFVGRYAHRVVEGGIGHNLPQESPQAFIDAIEDVDSHR